jgi:hypothetical protein
VAAGRESAEKSVVGRQSLVGGRIQRQGGSQRGGGNWMGEWGCGHATQAGHVTVLFRSRAPTEPRDWSVPIPTSEATTVLTTLPPPTPLPPLFSLDPLAPHSRALANPTASTVPNKSTVPTTSTVLTKSAAPTTSTALTTSATLTHLTALTPRSPIPPRPPRLRFSRALHVYTPPAFTPPPRSHPPATHDALTAVIAISATSHDTSPLRTEHGSRHCHRLRPIRHRSGRSRESWCVLPSTLALQSLTFILRLSPLRFGPLAQTTAVRPTTFLYSPFAYNSFQLFPSLSSSLFLLVSSLCYSVSSPHLYSMNLPSD